jgi:hypothetical protein
MWRDPFPSAQKLPLRWLRGVIAPTPRARPNPDNALVYVIRGVRDPLKVGVSNNPLKIGVSTDPNARLARLQRGSSRKFSFVYVGAPSGSAYEVQNEAHAMLDRYRIEGDWFDVSLEMAVGSIAAATSRRGQKIVEIPIERVDEAEGPARMPGRL